jgi:hypothetical protein
MIEAFQALVSADKSNEFNAPIQVEQGLSSKVRETRFMLQAIVPPAGSYSESQVFAVNKK